LKFLIEDIRRFKLCDQTNILKVILFTQGFWVVLNYRISKFIDLYIHIPFVRVLLFSQMYIWRKIIEVTTNIYLPWSASIGKGLHIAHCGYLVVHPETRIGDYCTLSQGVTIGIKKGGKYAGVPVIGNRVYISPNAIIIGGVKIGDDALVGAGAVVTKSIPPRAVVVGNPAKIISLKGSFDYIRYFGMENDPARLFSLSQIHEN